MIFVTGDCHGNFERFKPEYFPEQAQMTKRDIVICAGDFGGVWFGDGRDEAALDWLESLPFTLAFVCGPDSLVEEVPRVLATLGVTGTKTEHWAG